MGTGRDGVGVLAPVVGHDGDTASVLFLRDANHAGGASQDGRPLGRTGFEQLDYAWQPVGYVLARDASGVEGPHGELGAGFANGLGGDDTDSFAHLDPAPGGQGLAVAGGTDPVLGLAGQ